MNDMGNCLGGGKKKKRGIVLESVGNGPPEPSCPSEYRTVTSVSGRANSSISHRYLFILGLTHRYLYNVSVKSQ